ncbi:MAG: chorismate synthase [Bacteroidales bacterium]|jgi:chorismate synthase|nr:chorismate synthase [Bacteroidales bacterium]MDD4385479.1 chorismate synthase [Bacteroidales bacterium]MDY0196414.1 chorismate synthase [Tenuifilaceae bacterium]
MNSIGRIFRVTVFGESHGQAIGVTLSGVPAGIALSEEDFSTDLNRRKAGAKGTTPRTEDDNPEIVSGWFNGFTTGTPLTILFRNTNTQSADYGNIANTPRPGHADFAAYIRFRGFNDFRGGGHFSGRLTLTLVAAGVVAKKILDGINISAKLLTVGASNNIEKTIDTALNKGDSVGGIVECTAKGIPIGLGEPFFDSVESTISHLAFAVPAIKGIEFGSGFAAATMMGSQHNDPIMDNSGKTSSNNAGGITGGLTNGNDLVFRVAVKPTSSIGIKQNTFSIESGRIEELVIKGRHDACIALRVPVVIEAITAIALADFLMLWKASNL